VPVTRYKAEQSSDETFSSAVAAAQAVNVAPGTVHICTFQRDYVLQRVHLDGEKLCGVAVNGREASEVCLAPTETTSVGVPYNSFAVGYYSVPVFEACGQPQ
jgi:hypothetical protein